MYTRTIGAVAVASLVAGGAYAQSVNTDADRAAPFSTYKTPIAPRRSPRTKRTPGLAARRRRTRSASSASTRL